MTTTPGHHEHAEEHDDDIPVGRILSRREVLALLGLSGAAALAAACQPMAAAPTPAADAAAIACGR